MNNYSFFKVGALLVSFFCSFPVYAADYPFASQADLVGVYKSAVQNDVQLSAARHNYLAQLEMIPQARSGLLPNLAAGATSESSRLEFNDPSLSRHRSGTTFHANLSQPLFRADRWYQLKASKATVAQAELEMSAKEQALILSVVVAYFETLRQLDTLAALKAEEVTLLHQRDQTQKLLEDGVLTITDVLDVQTAYDNARANRQLAQRKVEDAYDALARLTKQRYGSIAGIGHNMPINIPVPNDAEAWVTIAVRQNLQLLASQYAVTAAEETIRQRKAGYAPTLDVTASYRRGDNDSFGYSNLSSFGQHSYKGKVEQSVIDLELNIPLYSGGLTRSQVRESTEHLYQAQDGREDRHRQVVLNTRNFLRAVNTDVGQVITRRQSIYSNQKSLEANKVGLAVGSRNIADVLSSQRQLYSSVRDYNNARYDYIIDSLSLKQAVGTLAPQDLFELSSYLRKDYNPESDFLPPDAAERGLNHNPMLE